jgi:hypothetical protein
LCRRNSGKAVVPLEKFYEFSQVMKDYKAEQIDPRDVKARVKELFKGHKHLDFSLYPSSPPISFVPLNKNFGTRFSKFF